MDEILIFSNFTSSFDEVAKQFKRHFELRISKRIEKFVGLTVEDNRDSMKIKNAPMVERMFKQFNLED